MALLFCDSYEHYSNSQIGRKWTNATLAGINTASPRTGSQAMGPGAAGLYKTFGSGLAYGTVTVGTAYQTNSFGNWIIEISAVFPGLASGTFTGLQVTHNGDGKLYVKPLGTVTPTSGPLSTFVMTANTYYYVECSATTTGTSCSYEVRINEVTILTGSFSFSVTSTPISGFTQFGLGSPGGGNHSIVDDTYVTDGEWLGDIRVYALWPRADGDTTTWTPSTAGAHYLMTKEHIADDSTTIVSHDPTSLPAAEQYYLDAITGFTGTIKGAQACWLVSKSDAGDASLEGLYKSGGGTIVNTAAMHPSYTSWIYLFDPQRKSVFTSSDWTVAEINAMQLGVTRIT